MASCVASVRPYCAVTYPCKLASFPSVAGPNFSFILSPRLPLLSFPDSFLVWSVGICVDSWCFPSPCGMPPSTPSP